MIAPGDGVDLNRNFPTKWGYDNEGSSPDPGSETYRGPVAVVRAGDPGDGRARQAGRLRVPRQLPLGRRAAALRHRLAGLHADPRRRHLRGDGRATTPNPAVPGYDPDISAELYTTNGDTDTDLTETVRHARIHAGDVHLRDRSDVGARRRVGGGWTARAASTSQTTRSSSRRSSRRTSRSRCRSRLGRRPRRPHVCRRPRRPPTSASTPSTSRTATRRPWRSWPSGP